MDTKTLVYEIYDFNDLKRELSSGANETLNAIEEKKLEKEFLFFINELLSCDASCGAPMTLEQLDDLIDYEVDYIEKELGQKLFEENEEEED